MSNNFDDLAKVLTDFQKRTERMLKLSNPYIKIPKYTLATPKTTLTIPRSILSEMSTIKIPKIPVINLPKFDLNLPNIKIDYEHIEKITRHNSSFGWTMTGEMTINFYLNSDFLEINQEKMDEAFISYYEHNNSAEFNSLKDAVSQHVESKWSNLLDEVFELFESGKFRSIIPTLITIIEGEIGKLIESSSFGKRLIKEWKESITDDDKYIAISAYSLHSFFDEKLFKTVPFENDRESMINRNWILHGRDNPELWKKADALRLLNVLSTIQFIKD